ncbi:unnamed protein product [Urochloa humidicola]
MTVRALPHHAPPLLLQPCHASPRLHSPWLGTIPPAAGPCAALPHPCLALPRLHPDSTPLCLCPGGTAPPNLHPSATPPCLRLSSATPAAGRFLPPCLVGKTRCLSSTNCNFLKLSIIHHMCQVNVVGACALVERWHAWREN